MSSSTQPGREQGGSRPLTAAVIYGSISFGAAGLFYLAAALGEYETLARIAGSGWVFLLSMIVTMPLVIPRVERRAAKGDGGRSVGSDAEASCGLRGGRKETGLCSPGDAVSRVCETPAGSADKGET